MTREEYEAADKAYWRTFVRQIREAFRETYWERHPGERAALEAEIRENTRRQWEQLEAEAWARAAAKKRRAVAMKRYELKPTSPTYQEALKAMEAPSHVPGVRSKDSCEHVN